MSVRPFKTKDSHLWLSFFMIAWEI